MAQDLRSLHPRRDVEPLVCPRPSGVSVGDRNNVVCRQKSADLHRRQQRAGRFLREKACAVKAAPAKSDKRQIWILT
jgi:hypothetical protein